jgi:hypothetical protein
MGLAPVAVVMLLWLGRTSRGDTVPDKPAARGAGSKRRS